MGRPRLPAAQRHDRALELTQIGDDAARTGGRQFNCGNMT